MIEESLKSRFPALALLERPRRSSGRIPWVQQTHATDCGAACLTMVLHHLGREESYEVVRDQVGPARDGVTALTILNAARRFGLRGRGVHLEMDDLEFLEPGAILHWEFRHFVVFESASATAVTILDPASGRRRVPRPEFSRAFTGVALLLEPGAEFQPKSRTERRWLRYVRTALGQRSLLTQVLLTTGVLQLFGLGLPLLSGMLVERVIPRGDTSLLFLTAVGVGGIVAFHLLTSLVRSLLLLQLRTSLDARVTLDFLEHMVGLPYSFFQLRPTGDLALRLNSNATIRETVTSGALSGILDAAAVLGYLLLLLLLNVGVGLLALALGILRVAIFLTTRRRVHELAVENVLNLSESSSYQMQMLDGMESLKAAGAEQQAVQHWSNLYVKLLNVSVATGRVNAVIDGTLGALNMGSPLIVLCYSGYLATTGALSVGAMLAMNALAMGFLTPISSLIGTALQLERLGSYIERVEDVFQQAPEQDAGAVQAAPPLQGGIVLRNVSFRYAEGSPWVLSNLSLDIRPGQRVAIVGRSGSGKSTLARLLVGLHRPSEGDILLDGHDLRTLELRSVRRQIGFVPQAPYVFGASIRRNIALGNQDLPLERVTQAARLASIHEDILAMPLGYETPMLAGGGSVSGGQRQRIALARALVQEPPILVLDEATSNLDMLTERLIHDNLRELRVTQVVVAHRLSTVRDADRILVMEDGCLVEEGTHDTLLAAHGRYAALVSERAPNEGRSVEAET